MQFTLKLAFILAYLYEAFSQICRNKNVEYNQLTIVTNETFRLPLNDYFVGDGLLYSLDPQPSPFTKSDPFLGSGTISGNIISLTSSNYNNNPNIQNLVYYALVQNTADQQIQYSQISNGPSFTQLQTVQTGQTCYQINFIQNMILLTCSSTSSQCTNCLTYQFVNQNNSQSNQNPLIFDTINIQTGASVITQAVGQYIVTLVNQGGQSNVYAFQISQNNQYVLTQITLNSILSNTTDFVDQYTGISLQENGILFITTYNTGLQTLIFNATANQQTTLSVLGSPINPFNQGTQGVSAYSVDYSQSLFYLAIWGSQGIAAGILNAQINQNLATFQSAQVIPSTQSSSNYSNNQVYMNSRFIVFSNQNGISVYPSILNAINDWQLLYYLPQSVQFSAFDYYNNILVAISGQYTSNYQFNNPILTTTNLPVNSSLTQLTITAVTSAFGQKNYSRCNMTLYFTVISQTNQSIIEGFNQAYEKDTYVQSGPLFPLTLGSITTVNINKMLIGPAIIAGYPSTKQAFSNIDIQFSNVLSTPQINSPYRINSNLIVGQRILYSEIFYDASYLINGQTAENFKDTYLQLVQVSNYVVLFQCQGFEDQPCNQITNYPVYDIIVQQFALSISSENSLYYGFLWKRVYEDKTLSTGNFTICQATIGSISNCKNFSLSWNQVQDPINLTSNASIQQIGLISDNLYLLYTSNIETYNEDTGIQVTVQTNFSAVNIQDLFSWNSSISNLPASFQTYNNPNSLNIVGFTYNVPAYGNMIFLNTWNNPDQYQYYLTVLNYNGGYINGSNQQWILTEVGTHQFFTNNLASKVSYELTMEGLYFLVTSPNANLTINFYPRVDLLGSITQYKQFLISPIQLNTYQMTNIVQTAASARFLYVMAMISPNSTTYSIFVYKNTPSLYNALYYIITTDANDQIMNAPFSVTSAIQYDGILFKSRGNDGYRNSILLPEYEFIVKCNLNSNFQQQIEYSYVIFKASSQLISPKLPQTAQEYFSTFESVNLISFVKEKNTASNGNKISNLGFTILDPRDYFIGNIQSFLLTNGTNDTNFYYFNITPPVQRYPQTTSYQYPVTAVSAVMQISQYNQTNTTSTLQDQYWFTFVQTNRLVYVTPYVYYNPPQDFVGNSTIKISYPLIYKLPVLDIAPNSQSCPLIFVDPGSQGIVSVCGTKVVDKFAASFTLFNPINETILETKIILLNESFVILNTPNNPNITNGTYSLVSGTYLNIGVVVLQFQYNYNYGSKPPALVIFSFLYTSNLFSKIASYPNNPNIKFYQFIQPIQQVFQVPDINLGSQIEVTPFSISTQYFGGLNSTLAQNVQKQNAQIFGLLCVSETKQECLQPFNSSDPVQSVYIINVVPVGTGTNLQAVFQSSVNVSFESTNNLITFTTPSFQVSLLSILSDFTKNSIQQVVQAGSPILEFNSQISVVPFVAISQGTAFVFNMQFYLNNAQYIKSQYGCTLLGLSEQNRILKVSANSTSDMKYQVVMIVSNPTTSDTNQVTLLNYGYINNYCRLSPTLTPTAQNTTQSLQNIVTAIGATTYKSVEASPILVLMQPPPFINATPSSIPRTLISDNSVITLLDTSPSLAISAYPNYNIKGGVTLNSTSIYTNESEQLLNTSISAISIQTYVNNQPLSGEGGSSLFTFGISDTPIGNGNEVWFHNIWGQFIWGFVMFVIIVGVVGFLFYKSQPQPYDRL
ncbi:unnamed protein product [Paramecium sonneborni]|uniref:Transmembrane protein n=1 Tax=Paramecium sonneborni TaxID=65129 RepID=A0A8S1PNU8_9CILI|nr:unnamed protein product [Paramecium sonneborni]